MKHIKNCDNQNMTYAEWYRALINGLTPECLNHPSMKAFDCEEDIELQEPFQICESLEQYEKDNNVQIKWSDEINDTTAKLMAYDVLKFQKQILSINTFKGEM